MAYVVKKGDTLNKIAAANGMSLSELLALNPDIRNPDVIQIGQTINTTADGGGDTGGSSGGTSSYTVVKGDTLNKIAAANGISLSELLKLNPQISNPDVIQIGQTINLPGSGEPAAEEGGGEAGGTGPGLEDSDPGNDPTTSDNHPGVLSGGRLIQVERPGQDDIYAVVYEYPPGTGQYISYEFDSMEQLTATFGPDPIANSGLDYVRWSDKNYQNRVVATGDAEEVIGVTGNFNANMDDAIQSAAAAAGVNDPTLIGAMASNAEMQEIMLQAVVGDWTEAQIKAAQRDTDFWKNTLYPGIENFYAGSQNPELEWKQYYLTVESTLAGLGYPKDADGTYKSTIGTMLNSGIEENAFVNMAPTYTRALQSEEFRASFEEWAQTTLGKNVTFEDWFDVLAGEAEVDLALAAERATIDYVAGTTGFEVENEQIVRLSNQLDLTEDQIRQSFATIDQALLGLMDTGMDRYGLSQDDIFASKTGIEARSGKSHAEIDAKIIQGIRELGLADDDKIALYTAYSENRGTPYRPGLNPLAPEGA